MVGPSVAPDGRWSEDTSERCKKKQILNIIKKYISKPQSISNYLNYMGHQQKYIIIYHTRNFLDDFSNTILFITDSIEAYHQGYAISATHQLL